MTAADVDRGHDGIDRTWYDDADGNLPVVRGIR